MVASSCISLSVIVVNRMDVVFLNRNALRIMGWKLGSRTRLFNSLIVGSSWSEFRLEGDEGE